MLSLLIVGAGPAGLNAAIAAAQQGIDVKVIDEFPKAGGRLLGQLYQEPSGEWWNGIEISESLYEQALKLGVDIQCEVSVFDISPSKAGWTVFTSEGPMKARKLLLATGATETPVPLPGWTLPGVMSIGAAQVMGNVHRLKPGNTCVIIGANVLSLAIAQELLLCGVQVKGIFIPAMNSVTRNEGSPVKVLASLMRLTHLAPSYILRQAGKIAKYISPEFTINFFPKAGIKMNGIPIHLKACASEIVETSTGLGVKTVKVKIDGTQINGSEDIIDADFVCISGGLAPMSELAAIAGCSFRYIPELGGHVPIHNERMRTNVPNLYVAGNITGVESAKVALVQGKVAGLTIAADVKGSSNEMERAIQKAMDEVNETRADALIQFQPGIHQARERLYEQFEETQHSLGELKTTVS